MSEKNIYVMLAAAFLLFLHHAENLLPVMQEKISEWGLEPQP